MYFEHFGLTQPPFKIVPNQEFYYSGGSRADILDKLVYAITCNDGLLIKVIGEPGTGKTMLATVLGEKLPAELQVCKIPSTALRDNQIPWVVADAMGLNLGKLPYERAVLVLQQHLARKQAQNCKFSLFVDEAQTLTAGALDEIYRLSSPGGEPFKLMQVVLFGQPELDSLLNQPQLLKFRDQITHSFILKHLDKGEVGDYLLFRMRVAGYRGPQVFSKVALREIYLASKGSIRRVNILADKALLATFLDNTHLVNQAQVAVALRESWFEPGTSTSRSRIYLVLLSVSILLTAFLWLFAWQTKTSLAPLDKPIIPSVGEPSIEKKPIAKSGDAKSALSGPSELAVSAISSVQISMDASIPGTKEPPASEVLEPVVVQTAKVDEVVLVPAVAKKKPVSANLGVSDAKRARPDKTFQPTPSPNAGESNGGDGLQSRLDASLEWIKKQEDNHFTIQLAVSSSEQAIAELQRIGSKLQLKSERIAAFRTLADGKPTIGIVSGAYPSMKEAREAVASLPPQLLEYSPLIRTFKGVRNEIVK